MQYLCRKNHEMDNIIGLGNALVDVLGTLGDDKMLQEMGLPKGSMTLIDENKLSNIKNVFNGMETHYATGGSAGNTIRSLAALGVKTGFIGKIGNDSFGDFYRESLSQRGTEAHLLVSDALPTGIASTFISPDGERTFGTYLGAAASLTAEELAPEMFAGYTCLYVEGYSVQDHAMMLRALELGKEAGLRVCLDMASYNIVQENRAFFSRLLEEYVDTVFANEEEATAFTGKEPEAALEQLAGMCSTAVVKIGKRGSLVRQGVTTVRVEAMPVDTVKDTTGAGDFFAAGFLYGLTHGCTLEQCARIGSVLAGEVIQVVGTALPEPTWENIRRTIDTLC